MSKFQAAAAVVFGTLCTLGAADRLVVEDFSDVGTWRTNSVRNITPGKWFGADVCLGGSPDASRDDGYAGKLLFDFADKTKTGELELRRAKVYQPEVFADGLEFDANPRGIAGKVWFTLEDADGNRFATPAAELSGSEWKRFRVDLGKSAEKFNGPFKIFRMHFSASGVAGSNYILIDDIAMTGDVSRRRKVSIRPVLAPLALEPGKENNISYRFRSASDKPLEGVVDYRLFGWDGKELINRKFPVSLDAYGSRVLEVPLPPLEIGSYNAELAFTSGKIKSDYTDFLAVFHPNNGRTNSKPMWFGIQDTVIWNGDGENELHRRWMKEAGFDIERLGFTGNRIDTGEVTNFPGIRKYLALSQDIGMICCASYTEGTPAYTQSGKPDGRKMPDKLDLYRKHMDKVFEAIRPFESVKYLEFWNEPDIGFYNGTFDEYLAAMKIVRESGRAMAPEIKITTGGVTIIHPKEKKNFSRDMYAKGKGLYDIACFHAHGSLRDYSERQELLEKWLKEAGVDLPVCNTETGERSGYSVDTIKRHAETLVKKITYAKSRNTEFYMWFTLQDYWDMDFEADDSFGLVNSDNRPKPSFIAYNELIRQLGDTGRGELLPNTGGLEIYRFMNDAKGREVLVLWPRVGGTRQLLALEGHGAVAAVDLFGRTIPVEVKSGYAAVAVDAPMYVSFPAGAFRIAAPVASQDGVVGSSAGSRALVTLAIRNPFDAAAQATVGGGKPVELAAHGTCKVSVPVAVPAGVSNGIYSSEQRVVLVSGAERLELTVPVTVNIGYPVAAGKTPSARLMVNTLDRVQEMSFDPNIPRWKGAKDLSCDFAMTHSGGDLKLTIAVTDDRHVMESSPEEAWRDDSIQIGFASLDGRFTELTLSGKDGKGAVWAHISPDAALRGEWKVPAKVTRNGDVTLYEVSLPLAKLGIADRAGTLFRFSFLINENDGMGRVRWIEWMSGIGRSKNPDEFGWGILQ